jgi:hypothetical protein
MFWGMGCSKPAEERPSNVEDKYSHEASTAVLVDGTVVNVIPDEEPKEETPTVFYGECWSGPQRIWSGKTVEFYTVSGTNVSKFIDMDTKKTVQIENAACMWTWQD